MGKRTWTKAEIRALITNVKSGTTDNTELAKMLNKTVSQVYDQRRYHGLVEHNKPRSNPNRGWSQEDTESLKTYLMMGHTNNEYLSRALNKTVYEVYSKRYRLGFHQKNRPTGQSGIHKIEHETRLNRSNAPYKNDDDHVIKSMFEQGKSDAEIGAALGRSEGAIKKRRNDLGMTRRKRVVGHCDKKLDSTEPVKISEVRVPTTEVSLLWGLVKYTKA